jgi:hypothetical protein
MLTISSWVFSSSIPTSSLAHDRNHKRDYDRIEVAAERTYDCHMRTRRLRRITHAGGAGIHPIQELFHNKRASAGGTA